MTPIQIDRARRLTFIVALTLIASAAAFAQEDPKLDSKAQKVAPTAFADEKPKPVPGWGVGDGKSYWVPAADIILFDVLLNLFDRTFLDSADYNANYSSFENNLTRKWVYDSDPFDINQFGHPYQGSMYHGFARSAGLGYWTSSGYTILGSALWELAGETSAPSINDQFTTGFAGSFLGEPLFRMASLLLESGTGRNANFWRELGAAAMSPSSGFNRWFHGSRFSGVFRSNNPAAYTRIDLGTTFASTVSSDVNLNIDPDPAAQSIPQSYDTGEVIGDFTIAYGLPGKPGYTYTRPFDYFHFQFTAASSNVLENVIVRGLLYGSDYSLGDNTRGIWGLYGTYDYIAPQIFRISSTGAALGTTAQTWLSQTVALQGTVMAGAGYGSAGTIRDVGDRDYHNGLTPQGLLALRLIFSDHVSLDLTARDYFVTDTFSEQKGGEENITRGDASLTWRLYNLHGITLKYVASRRDAKYAGLRDTHQQVEAISIGYAYLGQTRSGAVDWRPKSEGGP